MRAAVDQRNPGQNQLILNYMYLRKAVGWIGSLLPIVLIAGQVIFYTTTLPDSVSGYYYTHMRNVLVGSLCALAVFLIAYAGYDEWDRWITNVAGIGAIGVAFFPTTPPAPSPACCGNIVGRIHLVCAAVTFIALGVMALRFTKTDQAALSARRGILGLVKRGTDVAEYSAGQRLAVTKKLRRNTFYVASGITIFVCVAASALSSLLPGSVRGNAPFLYILESIAVFAFGVSWFVKGQVLFSAIKDE
jgi:hypothetical protein